MNELLIRMLELDKDIVDKLICVKDQKKTEQLKEIRVEFSKVINSMTDICS